MQMRFFVLSTLLLPLLACTRDEARPDRVREASAVVSASAAPAIETSAAPPATVAPSASASAAVPARIPCGNTTCAPNQFCLHWDAASGGADLPGKTSSFSTRCSDTLPHTDSFMCRSTSSPHQASCEAMIPAAPPRY